MAKEERFVKVFSQSGGFSGPSTYSLVDRQTGVNYLFSQSGYAGGMTPLLDREGKPIISALPVKE